MYVEWPRTHACVPQNISLEVFSSKRKSFLKRTLFLPFLKMAFQNLSIHARLPPRALFSWFFDDAPDSVPPRAPADSTWVQPFAISASIFHDLLDVKVPATIATVYLVSAISLNHLNKRRQNRPWRFAKSSAFKGIVLFHNAFLALFSAWTFYGLYYSLKICWPWATEQNILAQVADSLCRVTSQDGPRGKSACFSHDSSVCPFKDARWQKIKVLTCPKQVASGMRDMPTSAGYFIYRSFTRWLTPWLSLRRGRKAQCCKHIIIPASCFVCGLQSGTCRLLPLSVFFLIQPFILWWYVFFAYHLNYRFISEYLALIVTL